MTKSLQLVNAAILSFALFSANNSGAQCIVSSTPASFLSTYNDGGPFDYVQSFTATCSGNMQYFELTSTEAGTMPGATLSVYDGNVANGTAIYTQA